MTEKKRKFKIWPIVVVLALLVIFIPKFREKKETGAAQPPQGTGKVGVRVLVVTDQPFSNSIHLTGTVYAGEQVDIRSEITGRIISLNIQEGTRVKKGDLLVKIYDKDLKAQLNKLKLQKDLLAEREQREKQLLTAGAVSKEEYDVLLNQLNSVVADMQVLESQIEKTEIRAPFDGSIGLRYVSNGTYVSPTTQIASINNVDQLKIDFSVPERYMSGLKDGMNISFTVPNTKDTLTANIGAIEPSVDPSSRTLQVRAFYKNTSHLVFPGSFASITLDLQSIPHAILIPTESVIPDLKGQKVFVVKGNKAESHKIEIGYRSDTQVLVSAGLNVGDSLIVSGMMQLKPGAEVKVMGGKQK